MSSPSRPRFAWESRLSLAALVAGAALTAGCGSAGSTSRSTTGQGGGAGAAMTAGVGGSGTITGPTSGAGAGTSGACVVKNAEAMIVKQPVDIILVLDNSGSMADELAAVETNINVNFANILNAVGIDYRVILVSRHRKDVRAASGESSTSVCVEAPLSGLTTGCPSPANPITVPAPVFSTHFFQYNVKIESHDSLEIGILGGYNAPDTRTGLAPTGWQAWARPQAKKVFLEMSDDDEGVSGDTDILTPDQFIAQLTALVPANFGDAAHPAFVFHSIVGLAEKANPTDAYLPTEPIQMAKCTGNGDNVTNAGVTYQQLSVRTGGLRFPICQFSGYDAVFNTIANDVITKSQLGCDFEIPDPPIATTLDLDKVAVKYTKGDGSGSVTFGQSTSLATCQSNAFYIAKDATGKDRIYLCTDTCRTVQADDMGSVEVLFTCNSTIIR
jgi:hypothetical protein